MPVPESIFYATSGIATIQHLAVEILQDMADLELEQVPFQGGSPSVAAVVSGEVPFGVVSLNAAVAQGRRTKKPDHLGRHLGRTGG